MKAAVCYEFGKPLVVEDIDIDEPQKGEVKVRLAATAICHSDIHLIRGESGPLMPVVAGHESAGYVEEVGENVTLVKPGDAVVLSDLASCGRCYYCEKEMYNLCDDLHFVGITPGYPGGFAEQMALSGEILLNGIVNRMPEGLSFTHAAVSELCNSVLATHDKAGTYFLYSSTS